MQTWKRYNGESSLLPPPLEKGKLLGFECRRVSHPPRVHTQTIWLRYGGHAGVAPGGGGVKIDRREDYSAGGEAIRGGISQGLP